VAASLPDSRLPQAAEIDGPGTNDADGISRSSGRFMIGRTQRAAHFMATLQDLATRIDRLLLRHEELERTNKLLLDQVAALAGERDSLKSRLGAARTRIDTLLERLPATDGKEEA
jgi:cell division protein ZapB